MKEFKNKENLNWELVARYLDRETRSHENSEEEGREAQSEVFRNELKQSETMLHEIENYYQAKKFDTKKAWANVHSRTEPAKSLRIQQSNRKKVAILRFYKYAAIIVVALLLGSVGYYIGFKGQGSEVQHQVVSAENQVMDEITLPDGSMVTLNSNTQLQFPDKFEGDARVVTITGEAFFDVKPNPEKPFIIHAGNAQVKVLGTSFNVCAYPKSETIEVVVESGKVQVINNLAESHSEDHDVFLNPGEKGTLYNGSNILRKTENADVNYLAWKTHDLIFNEVPLSEVITSLEKVYHVDIHLSEPELNDLLLEARFDQKPIEFIMNVIQLTFDLELSVKDEQFTLSDRTSKQVKL